MSDRGSVMVGRFSNSLARARALVHARSCAGMLAIVRATRPALLCALLTLFAVGSYSADARAASATAPAATAQAAPAKPAVEPAPAVTAQTRCAANHLRDCVDALAETANDAALNLVRKIPSLILAALVVLLAHWIARVVAKRLHLLRIRSQNPYMSGLVRMIVRTAIVLIGLLIALDLLGMTSVVGAVLGSAGVVGLVLGFAFRDIAENYIAGILLSVRRPFEPGDHVVIENREGKVIAVNSRSTVLMTFDGAQVQLPNSLVFKSVVINYSRNPKRRFDFTMLIDGGQSIRRAQTLATEAIAQVEGVLDDPVPAWIVVEYGAAGIQLRFFGWVDQRESDLGKVRSEAIRQVKTAFADAGIEAPRTVYHVVAARARDRIATESVAEPVSHDSVDISVNRDIDTQIAEAKQKTDGRNLLDPNASAP